MTDRPSIDDWLEANQRYMKTALSVVRCDLQDHVEKTQKNEHAGQKDDDIYNNLKETASAMPAPPAIETLRIMFGLTPFERDILLLCAGIELDSNFAVLCASAHGDPKKTYPTFSLAMSALPDPHWSALSPQAPLRRWRLIEVGTGNSLTINPLRIDERVMNYIVGVQHLDERLLDLVEPLYITDELVPSHWNLVKRLVSTLSNAATTSSLPALQLVGNGIADKKAIATAAAAKLGMELHALNASFMPVVPAELDALIRLWEREAALSGSALLLECDDVDSTDTVRKTAINRFIECMNGPLIITSRRRWPMGQRSIISYDVHKPTANEQHHIWKQSLAISSLKLDNVIERLVTQFSLSASAIRSACDEVSGYTSTEDGYKDNRLEHVLWDTCRVQTRQHMDDLAQRIDPVATWDELVLPRMQKQTLREISVHVKQRAKVYEKWGFATKSSNGLGISALFAGSSGTGKTMAAEVLANELQLDLYRIDLSQVVSKYIGETEKNLRKVFDVAEEGGAILLFDEADALFGKRSEVRDSHDRYANIEVSYLLQRMETYRGLAILTTNMKDAIDPAFLRRIRFIAQFPFPDIDQRAEIWQRIFPANTPTEGVDMNKLARLNVAGGNIHNIALYAAFLAAEAEEPVQMTHLMQAARAEYVKIEQPLTDAEIGGWV